MSTNSPTLKGLLVLEQKLRKIKNKSTWCMKNDYKKYDANLPSTSTRYDSSFLGFSGEKPRCLTIPIDFLA
jgi:hypothetical protein